MTITDALRAKGYPPPVEVTGKIHYAVSHDSLGNVTSIEAKWTGGDVVSMTYELLENADSRYLWQNGDLVFFLDYRLRIIADSPPLETVYLERQR